MPEMPMKECVQQSESPENCDTPEREITQTDRINKKLLSSFLDRLNKSEFDHFRDPEDQESQRESDEFST